MPDCVVTLCSTSNTLDHLEAVLAFMYIIPDSFSCDFLYQDQCITILTNLAYPRGEPRNIW